MHIAAHQGRITRERAEALLATLVVTATVASLAFALLCRHEARSIFATALSADSITTADAIRDALASRDKQWARASRALTHTLVSLAAPALALALLRGRARALGIPLVVIALAALSATALLRQDTARLIERDDDADRARLADAAITRALPGARAADPRACRDLEGLLSLSPRATPQGLDDAARACIDARLSPLERDPDLRRKHEAMLFGLRPPKGAPPRMPDPSPWGPPDEPYQTPIEQELDQLAASPLLRDPAQRQRLAAQRARLTAPPP